jgi:hypothetical protein
MLTTMWPFSHRRSKVEVPWIEVSCGGEFPLEVHGESFHQPTLRALADTHDPEVTGDRIQATFMVGIRREPSNPHDRNAVAVADLAGRQLGHVPVDLASAFSGALTASEARFRVCCQARAYGRRINGDWNIGIWLAVPDAEQLAAVLAEATASELNTPGDLLAKRSI